MCLILWLLGSPKKRQVSLSKENIRRKGIQFSKQWERLSEIQEIQVEKIRISFFCW